MRTFWFFILILTMSMILAILFAGLPFYYDYDYDSAITVVFTAEESTQAKSLETASFESSSTFYDKPQKPAERYRPFYTKFGMSGEEYLQQFEQICLRKRDYLDHGWNLVKIDEENQREIYYRHVLFGAGMLALTVCYAISLYCTG